VSAPPGTAKPDAAAALQAMLILAWVGFAVYLFATQSFASAIVWLMLAAIGLVIVLWLLLMLIYAVLILLYAVAFVLWAVATVFSLLAWSCVAVFNAGRRKEVPPLAGWMPVRPPTPDRGTLQRSSTTRRRRWFVIWW